MAVAALRVSKAEAERLIDAVGSDDEAQLVDALRAVLSRLTVSSPLEWAALVTTASAHGGWTQGRTDDVARGERDALEQLAVDLNELRVIDVDGREGESFAKSRP